MSGDPTYSAPRAWSFRRCRPPSPQRCRGCPGNRNAPQDLANGSWR